VTLPFDWTSYVYPKIPISQNQEQITRIETQLSKVQNKCKTPNNKLFIVEKLQRDGKVINHLKVNYAPETIVIAKEVRNLKNMGFRLPFKVMSLAHNASTTYTYAISLLESISVYDSTNEMSSSAREWASSFPVIGSPYMICS